MLDGFRRIFRPSHIRCRRHKFGLNTFAACRAAGSLDEDDHRRPSLARGPGRARRSSRSGRGGRSRPATRLGLGDPAGSPRPSRVGLLPYVRHVATLVLDGDDERRPGFGERRLGAASRGNAFEDSAHFLRHHRRANDCGAEVTLSEDVLFDGSRDASDVQVGFSPSGACRGRGRAAGADQRRRDKRRDRDDGSATSSDDTGDYWSGGFDVHARILIILGVTRSTPGGHAQHPALEALERRGGNDRSSKPGMVARIAALDSDLIGASGRFPPAVLASAAPTSWASAA